jgi:SpoIIAA-like
MIELLKGFPDNADYDEVLIPDFEGRLRRHKKLCIYVEIASDLKGFDPGAVWADQKLGWKHFFDWERCVLVTDVAWAKHAARFSEFFGFLWPGDYRAFPEGEASTARDWISGHQESPPNEQG